MELRQDGSAALQDPSGLRAGTYTRVNELMEKYYYGGEVLKEYELRLLYRFLTMIRSSRKNLTLLERFRMRYDL